jgi:hypothetical protein
LDQAIAQRDQLISSTLESEIVVAKAQLTSAQVGVLQLKRQYDQLRAQDAAPKAAVAQVGVERAKITLDETQNEYNKALDRPGEDQAIRDSWAKQLEQAQLSYRVYQMGQIEVHRPGTGERTVDSAGGRTGGQPG